MLLDVFSRNYGRITCGSERCQAEESPELWGILVPFQLVNCRVVRERGSKNHDQRRVARSYAGRLQDERLYCGYYVNELILRMLHRNDPHEMLFGAYEFALEGLVRES